MGPTGVKDWRAPNHHCDRPRAGGWSLKGTWWIFTAIATAMHAASASLITGDGMGERGYVRRGKLEGRTYFRQVAASCEHGGGGDCSVRPRVRVGPSACGWHRPHTRLVTTEPIAGVTNIHDHSRYHISYGRDKIRRNIMHCCTEEDSCEGWTPCRTRVPTSYEEYCGQNLTIKGGAQLHCVATLFGRYHPCRTELLYDA